MDPSSDHLIQILTHIGTPLMASINAVSEADMPPQKTAEVMALLLEKSIELGAELGHTAEITNPEKSDEPIKLALASLASSIIAQQYKDTKGTVPDTPALKKHIAGMKAVLSFADKFFMSEEDLAQLKSLSAPPNNQTQIDLQYIQVFIPIIDAVSSFSFGQNGQKLITNIAGKLNERVTDLRQSLFSDIDNDSHQKHTDLLLLSALTKIYASCHKTETERLRNEDKADDNPSIDSVWSIFDIHVSLLEALMHSIASDSTTTPKDAAPSSDPIPVEAPLETAETKKEPEQESKAVETPAKDTEKTASPMGFFAQKKSDDDQDESTSQTTKDDSDTDDTSTSSSSGGSGSPMGFFAKKKDDDSD